MAGGQKDKSSGVNLPGDAELSEHIKWWRPGGAYPFDMTRPNVYFIFTYWEREKGAAQCWQKGATGKQQQKAFSPEAWEDFMLRVTVVWKAAKPGVELLMVHLMFTCAQALPEITQQRRKQKQEPTFPAEQPPASKLLSLKIFLHSNPTSPATVYLWKPSHFAVFTRRNRD